MTRSKYDDKVLAGTQRVYRFPNGYGASVVRNAMSYGNRQGLYELAVFDSVKGGICYSTPVTDDVIGWLAPLDVRKVLRQIESLPTNPAMKESV